MSLGMQGSFRPLPFSVAWKIVDLTQPLSLLLRLIMVIASGKRSWSGYLVSMQ